MALMKCRECGQDVSDKAFSCPHCGNPIQSSFALTEIYLDEITPQGGTGKIYVIPKEGDSPQPISSDRVIVTNLTFTKRTHPGAHDSVDINLELHFKSPNPQKQFEQLLQTSIARVSAATFDSDLNPTTSSVFSIGNSQRWQMHQRYCGRYRGSSWRKS